MKRRGSLPRYPWDVWLHVPEGKSEGTTVTLTRGIHFRGDLTHFRNRANTHAAKHGVFLRTKVLVTGKTIQITPYRKTSALDRLERAYAERGQLDAEQPAVLPYEQFPIPAVYEDENIDEDRPY